MDDARQDLLISRIVQGDAGEKEYDELAAIAVEDESIWRKTFESQRDQVALASMMLGAEEVTETVTAPVDAKRRPMPARTVSNVRRPAQPHQRRGRLASWTGWAMAALIFLAWSVGWLQSPGINSGSDAARSVQNAGLGPINSASEALNEYLRMGRDEGTVLPTEPRRVLVDTRPAQSGQGYELIYVRQIMERSVVPNLYRYQGEDEQGRPTLVRYKPPVRGEM